jgi:hypothetical protein
LQRFSHCCSSGAAAMPRGSAKALLTMGTRLSQFCRETSRYRLAKPAASRAASSHGNERGPHSRRSLGSQRLDVQRVLEVCEDSPERRALIFPRARFSARYPGRQCRSGYGRVCARGALPLTDGFSKKPNFRAARTFRRVGPTTISPIPRLVYFPDRATLTIHARPGQGFWGNFIAPSTLGLAGLRAFT